MPHLDRVPAASLSKGVTPTQLVIYARDEVELIAALAGCSLDEKPGSNWV
jgi:hypothetical protein